jgi:hypothetical protein
MMLRFIDLGKQLGGIDDDSPRHFAFYNTVTDMFIDLQSQFQVWDSWEHFERQFREFQYGDEALLQRFKNLCPDWVFTKGASQ